MSETNPVAHVESQEILAQWEGQAIHEPGVLFEEKIAELLPAETDVAAVVEWIALAALSGTVGNAAFEAIKQKVRDFLSGWQARFGPAKIDDVKERLLQEMQKYRSNRKITEDELRERIDLLFDDIQG